MQGLLRRVDSLGEERVSASSGSVGQSDGQPRRLGRAAHFRRGLPSTINPEPLSSGSFDQSDGLVKVLTSLTDWSTNKQWQPWPI